ncbi:MAG: hypothetical protein JXR19_08590 [Bacteroidia bacterium]
MMFLILIWSILNLNPGDDKESFREKQLNNPRVQNALEQKEQKIYALIEAQGISTDSFDIFIRAYKFEEDLEIWAKDRDSTRYRFITKYKFCSNVGSLGPKKQQGDLQIPEGLYELSKFNPESNYLLSLKVNYPNLSDSLRLKSRDMGGMIFIHGGCSTIGCIPVTDDKIKEVYVFSLLARLSGQEHIPIHIFPIKLSDENMQALTAAGPSDALNSFWLNLKQAYDLFCESYESPQYAVNKGGYYVFETL